LLFIYQTVAESFGSPNLNGAITRKYKVPLTISAYGDGLVAKGEIDPTQNIFLPNGLY